MWKTIYSQHLILFYEFCLSFFIECLLYELPDSSPQLMRPRPTKVSLCQSCSPSYSCLFCCQSVMLLSRNLVMVYCCDVVVLCCCNVVLLSCCSIVELYCCSPKVVPSVVICVVSMSDSCCPKHKGQQSPHCWHSLCEEQHKPQGKSMTQEQQPQL